MADEVPTDETIDPRLDPPDFSQLDPDAETHSAPDRVRVSTADEDVQDEPEEPKGPEITELTEEERAQFRSILTIGRRVKTVEILNQKIVISSLMSDDEIRIGAKVKEHRDSQAYSRAYQCATVAASIQSVNGESWNNTLFETDSEDVLFHQKYQRVIKIYPLVVQFIYQEVVKLDTEFAELAAKLGKL